MHSAQHNMSEGIFTDASYNFSDLARIYILQNRLSEAKWYLLQSNNISRRQRDDKHYHIKSDRPGHYKSQYWRLLPGTTKTYRKHIL